MKNCLYAAVVTGALILTGCSDTAVANPSETELTTAASASSVQTTVQSVELTDIQKANLDEFFNSIDIADEDILKGNLDGLIDVAMLESERTITYGESRTKKLIDKVKNSEQYHLLYADGNVKMETAVKGSKMKLAVCIDSTASSMFFEGNTIYSYYPIEKTGYKVTLSEEEMQQYTPESLLDSMLYCPENDDEAVNISSVSVDSENFICELFEGYAYIFREDGSIAMFFDNSNCFTARVETDDISDDIFKLPADYATIDYNQIIENLQSSAETNK